MRSAWIGIVVAAGMMAGCGGGGNTGSRESGQLGSGQQTYVAAMPTAGDYYTWENVAREQDSTVDYYLYGTKFFRAVAADGAASVNYLADSIAKDPLAFTSTTAAASFDSQGRWLGSSSANCTRTPSTPSYLVAPRSLAAGTSWQYSGMVQTKCALDPAMQTAVEFKDNILAMEPVTVRAGTFNTLRVTRSETDEDGNFRYAVDRTCWWEPDLGIDVKCTTKTTMTNKSTGETRAKMETESLIGYSNQTLGRKFDSVYRFMGNWKGRFDGSVLGQNAAGTCSLAVDWDGNITGSCTGTAVGLNVTGWVGADGALAFSPASNGNSGLSFTGKLDNIQQMSGAWSVPNYGSGTWTMTQD